MRNTCLSNARIYQLKRPEAPASCLVIQGERIVAVGDASLTCATPTWDLGGKTVLPALGDAHIHLMQYCTRRMQVDLDGAESLAAVVSRVAQRLPDLPAGAWLTGGGWDRNAWPTSLWPTRAPLDAMAPTTPVVLLSKDAHTLWCNRRALQLAAIDEHTPDPPGGEIVRDIHGEPTGVLKENACHLMWRVVPELPAAQVMAALDQGIRQLNRWGVASVQVMEGAETLARLQILRDHRMRFLVSLPLEHLPHAQVLGLRSGLGDQWVRLGHIKLFADGALGSQTAYLQAPYTGTADAYGLPTLTQEELTEAVIQAARAGWGVAVHAIGDRANHQVLNALEAAQPFTEANRCRHRIEHVQLLDPRDLRRFGPGIVASMQPIHLLDDGQVAERHWGARSRWAYAFESLRSQGAVLAFGSDAPVESPDPWQGMSAAMLRKTAGGAEEAWYPQECLSLSETLRAYTQGVAYAAGEERQRGQLEAGQLADLMVLDRDIFTLPMEEVAATRVLATMVGGTWVYVSEEMADSLRMEPTGNN